jgi:hypothetical protein
MFNNKAVNNLNKKGGIYRRRNTEVREKISINILDQSEQFSPKKLDFSSDKTVKLKSYN